MTRLPVAPPPPAVSHEGIRSLGLTIYGCEPDEAELFHQLSPRFGIRPTIVATSANDDGTRSVHGDRCVSVSHTSAVSAATLQALRRSGVNHVITRSIGFDHIDLTAADRLGMTVENVVYSPDGVADFTVMLILLTIRGAKATVTSAEQGDYRLARRRGRDLCDLTVGVVGMGRIGTAVTARLEGFGCRVLAHDPSEKTAPGDLVALDQLLRCSDVVTLHLPLDEQTRHVIGHRQLAAMKPGSVLVNTGRGALVDTDALTTALEDGHLGGAALDVIEGEDGIFSLDHTTSTVEHPFLSRLHTLPNVIVTPHTAFHTGRMLRETVEGTLERCLAFEKGPHR